MNKDQATTVLLQAVELAQTKGAFSLSDAKIIAIAVEILRTPIKVETEEKKPVKK